MLPVHRNLLLASVLVALLSLSGSSSPPPVAPPTSHAAPHPPAGSSMPAVLPLETRPVAAYVPLPPTGSTVILPNGTVSNASAPITAVGSVYRLTGDLAGPLWVERAGITVEGNGHRLTDLGGTAPALVFENVTGVEVHDLQVHAAGVGVEVVDSDQVNLEGVAANAGTVGLELASSAAVLAGEFDANASQAVVAQGVANVTFASCGLNGTGAPALSVVNGSGVGVWDSLLSSTTSDIRLNATEDVVVAGTTLDYGVDGVDGDRTSGLVLFADQMTGAGPAVRLGNSSQFRESFDRIRNASVAVVLSNDSNLYLTNETWSGIVGGLDARSVTNLTLNDSKIAASGVGVAVDASAGVTLSTVVVSAYGVGAIEVTNSTGVGLDAVHAGSGAAPGAFGLFTWQDRALTVTGGAFVAAGVGWSDFGSASVSVSGSELIGAGNANSSAIELRADALVWITGVAADHAPGTGITATGVLGLTVEYASLTHEGRDGVDISNSSGVVVGSTNAAAAGRDGFRLSGDVAPTLVGDLDLGTGNSSTAGADLAGVVGGNLALDNFTALGRAVEIVSSVAVNVSGSNLSRSGCALYLAADENLTITGDQAWSDALAFDLSGVLGSSIYHNNFESDSGWVLPPSHQSVAWDAGYPGGGNFWSNLTGPDAKSGPGQNYTGPDGVVDVPMTLNATNVDRYPLTTPWVGYFLTLTESGLAATTQWSVVVNGVPFSSYTTSVVYPFALGPGATYRYTIPRVPGYLPAIPNGSGPWPETRANVLVLVTFTPLYYTIVFQEYGLATGTSWQVVVGSRVLSSTSVSFTALLSNGSYNYVAGDVPGYTLVEGSGVVTEAGATQTILVVYAAVGASAATSSLSPSLFYALVGGLAVSALIAVGAVALLLRSHRRRPPATASPWAAAVGPEPPRTPSPAEARP